MFINLFSFVINFNIKKLTLSVNYVLNIFKNLYNVLLYYVIIVLVISVFLNKVTSNLLNLEINI